MSNLNLQEEIWSDHIGPQEQGIQLNPRPIVIEPEFIQISGKRLKLRICQQDDELKARIESIKSFFGASDNDLDRSNDTIFCDTSFNPNLSDISQLIEDCQKRHIQLSSNPIIKGIIYPQESNFAKCIKALNDKGYHYTIGTNNRRLQISVQTLRELDNDIKFPRNILPNYASGIFRFYPTPAYFIRKWLDLECQHIIKYENDTIDDLEKRRVNCTLLTRNAYFSEPVLQKLKALWELRLYSCEVIIEVPKDIFEEYDFKKSLFDFPEPTNEGFYYSFKLYFKGSSKYTSASKWKWQVDLLRHICTSEFGEHNYQIYVDYTYRYNHKIFHNYIQSIDLSEFYLDIKYTISDAHISISEFQQSIGIDFDWRNTTPEQLRIELSNKYDDIEVYCFSDHRCNVDINDTNIDWEEIEFYLQKNLPSLETYVNFQDEIMHFVQEYSTQEQASLFQTTLLASLNELKKFGYDFEIHQNPIGKKKYLLRFDWDRIAEDTENAVKTLRGLEFTAEGLSLGKFLNVIYPELLFDISSSDYSFSKNKTLPFNHITPNLDSMTLLDSENNNDERE